MKRLHFGLERELWRLHAELAAKSYQPGAYRAFIIHEPKPRQISAAPYRDRVVQGLGTGTHCRPHVAGVCQGRGC
jgi:hypothetical protein